jgi:hypothetical protein
MEPRNNRAAVSFGASENATSRDGLMLDGVPKNIVKAGEEQRLSERRSNHQTKELVFFLLYDLFPQMKTN